MQSSGGRVVASFFEGLNRERVHPDLLAEDVEWTMCGEMAFSGTHRGRAAVYEMFASVAALLESGTLKVEVLDIIDADSRVVVETLATARTVRGDEYRNHYCYVFTVAHDRLAVVHQYFDTQYAARVHRLTSTIEPAT